MTPASARMHAGPPGRVVSALCQQHRSHPRRPAICQLSALPASPSVSAISRRRVGSYQGVLGLAEAFTTTDSAGRIASVFFKVNDDQYIEVVPGLTPDTLNREVRVSFQSSDLARLHDIYAARGLNPTAISRGADGNRVFRVIGPDAAQLDFVQYDAGSKQALARGKFLDPRRISTHLQHVGIYTKSRDAVVPFYQDTLGFARGRDVPAARRLHRDAELRSQSRDEISAAGSQ